MLRLATLCTLLTGAASFAQTVLPRLAIVRLDDPNLDTYTFGVAECNDTLTLGWTNTLTIPLTACSSNPLKIWSTAGECQETPGTADTRYEDVPSLTLNTIRQGTFSVKIAELPEFKTTTTADGGTNLPCASGVVTTKIHRICASVEYANFTGTCGAAQRQTATSLKLVFDTQPPSPPEITEVSAQDQAVRLGFTVDSDTSVVTLEVKGPTDADWREIAETASTNGLIRGDKLENNVPYFARLRARDAAGNASEPSTEIQVTPIRTVGFWGYYKDAGGTEQGGCSVGVGLLPLLLAAFAFRRARKQVRRDPR